MRLGLAARLALPMALIGIAAAGLTGYYGYAASRQQLTAGAEQRLLTATRVLARQLVVGLQSTAADVRLIAEHPLAPALLAHSDVELAGAAGAGTAQIFQGLLATRPAYFQVRLIDAERHGLERIRVDRTEGASQRVLGDDLQEKGHYPYVYEVLGLPRGAVHVSRASVNHEVGALAGLDKPSLQMAAPVVDAAGRTRGLVVVNVDLEGLFRQLAADLPPGLGLYLVNGEGDYLIHPDRELAFAFDRGRRAQVQQQFAEAAELLRQGPRSELVTRSGGDVAAFVRLPPTGLQLAEDFLIGLAQPLDAVLEDSRALGLMNLRLAVLVGALSVLAALLLARALIRPLQQIVESLRAFHPETPQAQVLPLARSDEIGHLARSVNVLQEQIRHQFDALAEQRRALDQLASHDSLTGLLNRRVFLDRLEHALARAQRSGERLALLFIDLDGFKAINDRHGHAAGDALLQTLAQRLREQVRAEDTVARLGGDEFVVLIDHLDDEAGLQTVLAKLRAAVAEPVPWAGGTLQGAASIGVARYPQDGGSAMALLAAADEAMYRAKAGAHRGVQPGPP
jgi:diguanylate cyclase (GGDEF)-like protein